MATQEGLAHVMLSVTDAAGSAEWYRRVFEGRSAFSGKDDYSPLEVVAAGNLVLGFRSHPGTAGSDRFEAARVGLDHVAIGTSGDQMESWLSRLEKLKVPNSGIIEDPFGKHLNFRDPDNIALEIYAPAS